MVPAGLMETSGDHKRPAQGRCGRRHRRRASPWSRKAVPRAHHRAHRAVRPGQGRGMTTRTPARRRRRQRGRRAARPPTCSASRPHVTLYEARHPARRPRGHPPSSTAVRRRHRLHRAQRAHLPHLLRLFDELGVADPGLRDVDVGALRRDRRWSTPARSACPACSRRGATPCVRRTCGCSRRSRASTGWRSGCWFRQARPADAGEDDETLRSFLERGRFSPTVPHATSWSRWWPACGRATRRSRSTTPRATCSPSSSTTACSASSARRSGAPSPAGRGSTSSAWPPACSDVRTGTKVTSVLETPTRVEITDGNGQVDRFDAVVVATHPDQALAMLAEPTDRAARGARAPWRTPPTPRSCTPTPACCRDSRAPGRRGTTCAGRADDQDRRCHRQLRPDPAQRLPVPADGTALPRHARRPGPRRPVAGHRHDGVRAPHLHADLGGRPAPAARVRHRPGRLRRRLARLGLPRGRRPLRRRGGRRLGVEWTVHARAPGRGDDVRHHDPAHPSYAVQADLHPPVAHLAGRPRPPARPRCPRALRGARPPRRPGPHPQGERRALPRPQRRASPTAAAS